MSFELPSGYGWVGIVAASTFWLTMIQMTLVGKWRHRARIPYPRSSAEKAEIDASEDARLFSCAQRAHTNTMEHLPQFLFALLFSGVRYPKLAATLGAGWMIGRVLYTIGYLSGEPKRRHDWQAGRIHHYSLVGLQIATVWSSIQMILGH